MPKIEVYAPESEPGYMAGYGTIVKMDGQPVQDVRSVKLTADTDDIVRAELEVLVSAGTRWVAEEARVLVSVVTHPDFEIVAEPQPDGTTVYTAREAGKP
jgi:hypothetical protein